MSISISFLKKLLTVLFIILTYGYGQTNVSGVISSNTTWTLANSPYVVTGNILVSEGVTLTIEPGVVVKFDSEKVMQIRGELIAQGTSDSKITFTSNASSPAAGDWEYLTFYDESTDATYNDNIYTGGSILQYCIVEYAKAFIIDRSAPYVSFSEFRYNSEEGIKVGYGGDLRINNCDIHHNNRGIDIYISQSNSLIDHNTIRDNSPEGGGETNGNFSYKGCVAPGSL